MTEEQFDKLVENRLEKTKSILVTKGKEYRRNNNPLHNFDEASRIGNVSREKALWGFALKHQVSLVDLMNDLEQDKLPSLDLVDEKIGDMVNYLILLEASIKDKINLKAGYGL